MLRSGTLAALSLCLAPHAASSDVLAIRDATVVPMSAEIVLMRHTLIISDGIIKFVGPASEATIPPGARVIDGSGLFVMPGLIDAHVHPSSPAELTSHLLYGQTTILTLAGEGLAAELQAPGVVAPHVVSSSFTLDGTPPTNRRFMSIARPEDAGPILDREIARGARFAKVYARLDAQRLCAIHRAARHRRLAVVGHIPRDLAADEALACMDMVAHGEEFFRYTGAEPTESTIAAVAASAKQHHIYVTPNIVAYKAMYRHATALAAELNDSETAYLAGATYQELLPANNRYARRPNLAQFAEKTLRGVTTLKRLTAAFHEQGVPLLAGTDAPILCFPGRCLVEEIALLHEAGLSTYEALRAATANVGRFARERMHLRERFGVIEEGARADLLLLGANPLSTLDALKDVRAVIVEGVHQTKDQILAARNAQRAGAARDHDLVDAYERFITIGDVQGAIRFLDAQPSDARFLNMNVILFDALELEAAGRRPDAIALLEAVTRLLSDGFGLHNEIGRMQALDGNVPRARAAYMKALSLAPLNGVAQQGLASLP